MVVFSRTSKRRPMRFVWRLKCLKFLLAASILALIGWQVGRQPHSMQSTEPLRACSYEELFAAFGTGQEDSNDEAKSGNVKKNCWSLAETVLQVPASAVDTQSLKRLGSGFKGSAQKTAISIGNGDYCNVVTKTDHCHSVFGSNFFTDRTSTSCLQPYSFLFNDASYIGGEYTGALVHQALRHVNKDKTRKSFIDAGVLPTWGVVQDIVYPQWTRLRRSSLQGSPHTDGTLKAVIMPLVESFTPLNKLSSEARQMISQNATTIARTMLPAAEGLALVNGMRLAFQDLIEGNIGIVLAVQSKSVVGQTSGTHFKSFVYDHTYLTLQPNDECTLPDDQSEACNFCYETAFESGGNYTNHRYDKSGAIKSDMEGFRSILLRLFRQSPESTNSVAKRALLKCNTIEDVVSLLREYQ